jgi:hypothetical protein
MQIVFLIFFTIFADADGRHKEYIEKAFCGIYAPNFYRAYARYDRVYSPAYN